MLKIRKEGTQYRVELFQVNRFNTLCSELVQRQLEELVEEPGNSVIFNLEGIRFIDTAGFGVLLHINNLACVHGSRFSLCNLSDDVKELMQLQELGGSFDICSCKNEEEKILMVLD